MKHQFPSQNGAYIVKVKPEQSTDAWGDFKSARMQISVGQDYHEGDKLASEVEWCAARFDSVKICVNDTLQRFNTMFESNMNEDQAYKATHQEGTEWIKRNECLWNDYPHLSIVRWDEWRQKPEYKAAELKISFLYAGNPAFKLSIDDNVIEIWNRRQKSQPHLYTPERFSRFFGLSKLYLLEEITAFSIMFEQEEAIDIYPGTTIFAATVFKGQQVFNAPSGLGKGHFCRIDFSRNKRIPQSNDLSKMSFG